MPEYTTHAIKCQVCGGQIGRRGVNFVQFKRKVAGTRTRCKVCAAAPPETPMEGQTP